MQTIAIPDAIARKVMRHTGKRTPRAAVLALAEAIHEEPVTQLVEGKKHYRASAKLLNAVKSYRRNRAITLPEEELQTVTARS